MRWRFFCAEDVVLVGGGVLLYVGDESSDPHGVASLATDRVKKLELPIVLARLNVVDTCRKDVRLGLCEVR